MLLESLWVRLLLVPHSQIQWNRLALLMLVSFGVKRAYNNVAKGPELETLRQRRVPEQARWIHDICTDRQACVTTALSSFSFLCYGR